MHRRDLLRWTTLKRGQDFVEGRTTTTNPRIGGPSPSDGASFIS
jgi:hypothetical protein